MTKRINLALQGGGAHGAYTWGVLDRILEDDRIEIAAVSATSAGALNGAALKAGLSRGGPLEAKADLAWLWSQMGAISDMRLAHWMTQFGPATAQVTRMIEFSMPVAFTEMINTFVSPYGYGVFYKNPLERVVKRLEFQHVCSSKGPEFFVSATNVRTGKIRVFSGDELSTDVILASACLPELFQAVRITDPVTRIEDDYWDGGFTGNPALFPLFEKRFPDDVLVVNINPLERKGTPMTPQEIQNRINEVSFNSSLLRELRAIQFVKELIEEHRLPEGMMKNVLVHMISDDDLMNELSATTKLVPSPILLKRLHDAGYDTADAFLETHFDDLNERSTVDLEAMFD